MAKLTLTLIPIPILAFFLLLSLSDSFQPSDLPDLNGRDVLLLPSDNPRRPVPETDTPAVVADPKSVIAKPDLPEGFTTVPLNKLEFREGNIPLSLRFPHRRRGCRHGFMRRHGMRPREIPYGNDMILSEEKLRPEEFVGKARFQWVNQRPRFEVAAPWKGEEDVFKMPKKFERGYDEDMFKGPKKFRHHDEDDDVIKRQKNHDDDDHMFEMVEKFKHHHDNDEHMFRMPRKFKHHDDDDDDWHGERHHHVRFGRHHHKHHHDDDEEDEAHKHGKRHHHEDDDDKAGILSNMRKFFDDLF